MPLYKYFSPDRSGVLETCELRVTPFSELNDPFEAAPVFAVPNTEVLVSRLRKLVTETVDSRLPALDAAKGLK